MRSSVRLTQGHVGMVLPSGGSKWVILGGGHPPETKNTRRSTHPVDDVDSPHRAHFGRVIDEADVSLRGSVQLSDLNVAKAVQKVRPDVRSDPVADSDPHFVVLLVVFLQKTTQESKQRPAKFKSD